MENNKVKVDKKRLSNFVESISKLMNYYEKSNYIIEKYSFLNKETSKILLNFSVPLSVMKLSDYLSKEDIDNGSYSEIMLKVLKATNNLNNKMLKTAKESNTLNNKYNKIINHEIEKIMSYDGINLETSNFSTKRKRNLLWYGLHIIIIEDISLEVDSYSLDENKITKLKIKNKYTENEFKDSLVYKVIMSEPSKCRELQGEGIDTKSKKFIKNYNNKEYNDYLENNKSPKISFLIQKLIDISNIILSTYVITSRISDVMMDSYLILLDKLEKEYNNLGERIELAKEKTMDAMDSAIIESISNIDNLSGDDESFSLFNRWENKNE